MKRRQAVKAGLIAAAGATLAACQPTVDHADADDRPMLNWRLASSFPSSLDTLFGAAVSLSEKVSALTSGRFSIEVYQGGELVPGLEVFDAVQSGGVQIGHTSGSYFVGKDSALSFEATIPFGLNARQHNSWLYDGNGISLIRDILEPFNIINFPGGNTGAQMGGWFRRPINSISDLDGLRMRVPGLGGEVLSRLGVSVQLISAGEVFQALDRGALDATEFAGPYDDLKLGFNQVTTHYYYPGWWEPCSALSFYVNKESWESLPGSYKSALAIACDAVNLEMLARYDARNARAFTQVQETGVTISPFPQDIMLAAFEETETLLSEKAANSQTFQRVYSDWRSFKEVTANWFATAELQIDQSSASLRPGV